MTNFKLHKRKKLITHVVVVKMLFIVNFAILITAWGLIPPIVQVPNISQCS